MRTLHSPSEAYRRVDFDARVIGADPRQLLLVCYEQLDAALGRALHAAAAGDNAMKSDALTRALTAISALQLGVDPAAEIAQALNQLYGAARQVLLNSALQFNPAALKQLRGDFFEISQSLNQAG